MRRRLVSIQPDGPLYRLARRPDPWSWADWSYAPAESIEADDPDLAKALDLLGLRLGAE